MDQDANRQHAFGLFASRAFDGMEAWADANQEILKASVDFTTSAAAEGLRLFSGIQASTIEAAKAGRDYWLGRLNEAEGWQKDPLAWYHKAAIDGLEETTRAVARAQENAGAVTRSAEKLQATVELTAEKIQQTMNTLVAELQGMSRTAE